MIKVAVDLHIHSCLSPCANPDMTPNNIVHMAKLKGLDGIAVCDHNHTGNLRVISEVALENGILVIPGIELETSEEIHLLCYFPSLSQAYRMQLILNDNYLYIPNREDIYGEQWILNERDEPQEKIGHLLASATKLDLYSAVSVVRELGGVAVPAHIDRESYSIISSLGTIPEDLNFGTLELSACTTRDKFLKKHPEYSDRFFIRSSDAHDLGMILEREFFIEVESLSSDCLFNQLFHSAV